VLTVPFQRTQARSERRAGAARTEEVTARLEQERRLWTRLRREAEAAYRAALRRMDQVESAVDNAVKTLEAERERFRLGEGRSRNVLDAQEDLTKAELRRNAAAADLLRAAAALDYAAGYPRGLFPESSACPAARDLLDLCLQTERKIP